MKVLELFAGSRSISKAFEAAGHLTFSVDWQEFPGIDLVRDIEDLEAKEILLAFGRPDVIWASPDCTSYSVAAISHHRRKQPDGSLAPVSEYAKKCDRVNVHLLELIAALQPKYWFIENPRGGLRKMDFMQGVPRHTVTYCQYGDTRMKPTDIWTNHPAPDFKPMCKNGDPCHERAPRSATVKKLREQGQIVQVGGTQYRLKNSYDRSMIPEELCRHIVSICEK